MSRALALAAVAVAACLAGCSSDAEPGPGTSSTAGRTAPAPTDAAAPGSLADVAVRLDDLGLDLADPVDLTFRPTSTSLLVAERAGTVREAAADGRGGFRVADGAVLDVTGRVGGTDAERGLLGLAVSPDGDELYVSYTEAGHGDSRVDAYPLRGEDGSLRADPAGRRQLLGIGQPFSNHNGGSLRVGPDGMLYAGFGDGGSAGDPDGNGQDPRTLLGSVVRLDPTGRNDRDGDGIPDDNPFVTPRTDGRVPSADAGRPEIWLTGVRNPWRIDFDPDTGDLWIGDVGQDEFEEIDVLHPGSATAAGFGANLGWDLYEGDARFADPDPAGGGASDGPFVEPVYVYSHDDGCSVTGGVVYRGTDIPALDGAYLFGDYCTPGVRALRGRPGGGVDVADLDVDIAAVVSFARGPDGEVYVVSLDDGVQRLRPA